MIRISDSSLLDGQRAPLEVDSDGSTAEVVFIHSQASKHRMSYVAFRDMYACIGGAIQGPLTFADEGRASYSDSQCGVDRSQADYFIMPLVTLW